MSIEDGKSKLGVGTLHLAEINKAMMTARERTFLIYYAPDDVWILGVRSVCSFCFTPWKVRAFDHNAQAEWSGIIIAVEIIVPCASYGELLIAPHLAVIRS